MASMTRFAIGPDVALRLATEQAHIGAHQLVAPVAPYEALTT